MVPSFLTAHDATGHVHLIVGSNPLANDRCNKSLEVGAKPIVLAKEDAHMHYALSKKIEEGKVQWIKKDFQDEDLKTLGRKEVDYVPDAVFVTSGAKTAASSHISALCRRFRIPVNVTDSQNLSSFALLSMHSDGPLQIGITTSGNGCKLASRIRREISFTLPPNLGDTVARLGTMRRRVLEEDYKAHNLAELGTENSDDDAPAQKSSFNQLVNESDSNAAKTRRMRWLSQICEYWPLKRLALITDENVERLLQSYQTVSGLNGLEHGHEASALPPKPQIILAGSGPGSLHLLTVATQEAIRNASVILADKLVPAPVLDLVPRRTPVHIARKFPGNADAAQQELLEIGLGALKKGLTVLRLKQGDPYIFGRGGEEYAFFEEHGFKPIVLPGITSALSAPLFAMIPPTHRNVSDQVLICTGTGRKGAAPPPPPYVESQTVVFLMALHRLQSLVESLVGTSESDRTTWPITTPCAVIERASCPDQRVIRTTLEHVVAAVNEEGSRPPGLLVLGRACDVLKNTQGHKWIVEDGFAGFGDVFEQVPSLTASPKE
ncbi:hypothetical protein MMC10_002412 [Thelotrema lepadinum]|nr:hypothetical protein [Thelotrema lepadinum]